MRALAGVCRLQREGLDQTDGLDSRSEVERDTEAVVREDGEAHLPVGITTQRQVTERILTVNGMALKIRITRIRVTTQVTRIQPTPTGTLSQTIVAMKVRIKLN